MSGRLEAFRARRRPGRAVRRLVRSEWKQVRRENRWRLAGALGIMVASVALVVAVSAWLGAHPFVLGMVVGTGLGAIPLFIFLVKVASGIAAREFGADAEQWTAAELRRLDAERWRVFHDIPVSSGNVDHVAVGPGRVYAIETKWTTARGRFRDGFAKQAARRAGDLQQELARRGVARDVIALLVIWGKGVAVALGDRPELDRATQTRIMAGANASDWLGRMDRAADGVEVDEAAARAVQAIIDDAAPRKHGPV